MHTEKGSIIVEFVAMGCALFVLMFVVAQFTMLFITSERTMINANAKVWDHLHGINTPCLENVATGEFEGGKYALTSGEVKIGLESFKKSYKITKDVTFVVENICN